MNRLILTISIIAFAGCATNNALGNDSMGHLNVSNLAALRKGMGEMEAIKLMGQPYDYQTFCDDDAGDRYDVWFYVTTRTALDQNRMVPMNLTALAFKNGILVGWGYNYYTFLSNKYGRQTVKLNPPPVIAPPEEEEKKNQNQEIEESLKKAVTPPAPPNQP